jgi:hypothetical protein
MLAKVSVSETRLSAHSLDYCHVLRLWLQYQLGTAVRFNTYWSHGKDAVSGKVEGLSPTSGATSRSAMQEYPKVL